MKSWQLLMEHFHIHVISAVVLTYKVSITGHWYKNSIDGLPVLYSLKKNPQRVYASREYTIVESIRYSFS